MVRLLIFGVTVLILFALPMYIAIRLALKKAAQQPGVAPQPPFPVPPPPFRVHGDVEVHCQGDTFSFFRRISSETLAGLGEIAAVPADVRVEQHGDVASYRDSLDSYLVFSYLPDGLHGSQIRIGPLAAQTARDLAAEFQQLLPRARELVDATEEALAQSPASFHGRVVRITGEWGRGVEYSSLANHSFRPPPGVDFPMKWDQAVRVTAVCLFLCNPDGKGRYGHMGLKKSELRAFEILAMSSAQERHGSLDSSHPGRAAPS